GLWIMSMCPVLLANCAGSRSPPWYGICASWSSGFELARLHWYYEPVGAGEHSHVAGLLGAEDVLLDSGEGDLQLGERPCLPGRRQMAHEEVLGLGQQLPVDRRRRLRRIHHADVEL